MIFCSQLLRSVSPAKSLAVRYSVPDAQVSAAARTITAACTAANISDFPYVLINGEKVSLAVIIVE